MTRVRIPPSPTGLLHIGTARTMLFNVLFARQAKGEVVFRFEDTDRARSTVEFEKDIEEGMKWLGLSWNEGPDIGGPYGPYRQTERSATYEQYIKQLIDTNKVYPCFCTNEQLEQERKEAMEAKRPAIYSGKCANLTEEQLSTRRGEGLASTLRFRVQHQTIRFHDLIRGEVEFDTSLIGDIIVAKDEKTPLYNLAVVIDDQTMDITHVIRGEDHISNTPKQMLLIQALGFRMPIYAHIPLILDADRTKLSKRRNKVSMLEYRKEGYLPEAMINFLAFLGWNPGTEEEIFSLDELVERFDISRVQKSGAIFNLEKLSWLNAQYIRSLSPDRLVSRVVPFLVDQGYISCQEHDILEARQYTVLATDTTISRQELANYLILEQERAKTLADFGPALAFCFADTLEYESSLLQWKDMTAQQAKESLKMAYEVLETIDDQGYTSQALETIIKEAIAQRELHNGQVLWPLRVALSGLKNSPGPFDIAHALGRQRTLARVQAAIDRL